MPLATSQAQTTSTPQSRLELARELFRKFHAQCFWSSPGDLEITNDLIPFVAKGLRTNGGQLGFVLAGKLQPSAAELPTGALERDALECR
jgi:hypothetical protein